MVGIRAFVGHSFTEDDAAIVDAFLKYFTQLSHSLPEFSWEHAEAAEPKQLTQKVMERLADKNAFIGICTRKEYVASPLSLKNSIVPFLSRHIDEKAMRWKTSDWIIQEIGLAIGKALPIILLIEDNVRQPGGLQGNVEYITFVRENPEKCFPKVMEMLSSLMPSPSVETVTSSGDNSESKKDDVEPPASDAWKTPKSEWTRQDYEFALFHMLLFGDEDGINHINRSYLSTQDAARNDNAVSWHTYVESERLRWGKGGSLARLRELADQNPDNPQVLRHLARGLTKYEKHEESARVLTKASQRSADPSERGKLLGYAGISFAKANLESASVRVVDELRQLSQKNSINEVNTLRTIKGIAELYDDTDAALGAMERLLDIDPSQDDLRFSIAYKYANHGGNDLAIQHYRAIPREARTAMVWNNLGVALGAFSLSGKSIEAFQKAAELGESLAMSNLANKLIAAGFFLEAQHECDRALQIKDYHKNVALTLAKLKEAPENEATKDDEIARKAVPKINFYRSFGIALACVSPVKVGQSWIGPHCTFSLDISGIDVVLVGSYTESLRGLLSVSPGPLGVRPRDTQRRIEYRGRMNGRTIKATVKRTLDGESAHKTILGSLETEIVALMILSEDGKELKVMERGELASPEFYSLTAASAE